MPAVNWQNHTTIRTCVYEPHAPPKKAMDLCTGYVRAKDAIGAVTDVHYVTIQIERVYFRDLPEWTRDAELSVDVAITGLLPGGKEYRQVLDIVHVKKEAYLQIQNVSINFPIRYENRVVSLTFSLRELDDVASAKKWFKKGKKLLSKVKANPLAGGFLGAVLVSEITEDLASIILDEMASDDHVFALKQVDFLPVANTTGIQEQLLFSEGRYVVVAIPPTDAYEVLQNLVTGYPETLDRMWLEKNAAYRGGYLVQKETLKEYVFTPYVAFNFAVLKRYADRSPIMDGFKQASRYLDMGDLEEAKKSLAKAYAGFKADAGFSFKKAIAQSSPEKRGLLDLDADVLLDKVGELVVKKEKDAYDDVVGMLFGGGGKKGGLKSTGQAPAADAGGIYTEKEYSFFLAFMKAIGARGRLVEQHKNPTPDQIMPVLEEYLAIKGKTRGLPLFNSECEVMTRGAEDLWAGVKKGYNIPNYIEVKAGQELADALSGVPGDKAAIAMTLLRLQKELDWLRENCLETKSTAY